MPEVNWDDVRNAVNAMAVDNKEWAGCPVPVHGLKLVIEKRHPYQGLQGAGFDLPEEKTEEPDFKVRNHWFSLQRHAYIYIIEEADGRITKEVLPLTNSQRLKYAINTLGVASSHAWTVDAEANAMSKLHKHIGSHKMKQYVLSGSFLETSPRSRVTYLFRKLRPTLALVPDKSGAEMQILCALCLHPIGFYAESHAGVMTPTDCVISHLLMMRACERKLWSKANQHPPWATEAGI
jgi:hypothetical protein